MLKPAVLYKEELEKRFMEVMYDDEYFLYMGYAHGHELPKIEPRDHVYQWAIISNDKVVGYFAYQVQPETDTAYNFGLYGFDKNYTVGRDVLSKMEELTHQFRRVEWRVIGGNPVIKHYDKFCKEYKGNRVTLHKAVKAPDGSYRDEHIYEICREY